MAQQEEFKSLDEYIQHERQVRAVERRMTRRLPSTRHFWVHRVCRRPTPRRNKLEWRCAQSMRRCRHSCKSVLPKFRLPLPALSAEPNPLQCLGILVPSSGLWRPSASQSSGLWRPSGHEQIKNRHSLLHNHSLMHPMI